MFKKLISLSVSAVMLLSLMPQISFAISDGDILLEEKFNFQAADSGKNIGGWNGWTESGGANTQYTLDSYHTLTTEPGTTNGVGSLYREACGNNSAAFTNQKVLSSSQTGGKVSVKMSVKRTNAAAKLLIFRYYDTENHMVGQIIDLNASRIYTENAGAFPNFYFPGITSNTASPTDVWQDLEWVFDFDKGTFNCCYGQGGGTKQVIAQNYNIADVNNGSIAKIEIGTQRNANGAGALFYIDNIEVKCAEAPIDDEKACTLTDEYYKNIFKNPLENNISLTGNGLHNAKISWSTSDSTVITASGKITRVLREERSATLTARISRGTYSVTKTYDVKVKGFDSYITPTQDIIDSVAEEFSFAEISTESVNAVSKNLDLCDTYANLSAAAVEGGVDVKWESSDTSAISEEGVVTRKDKRQKVTLTATFSAGENGVLKRSKEFQITILPAGEIYLYETFDMPSSENGTNLDGWNGWTMSYAGGSYRNDSEFTISNEENNEQNKVASFYRPTCDNNSMYITAAKTLERTIDGGEVNLKIRLNRKTSNAKLFMLQFQDDAAHQMEFYIDLANSRIYSGASNSPAFDMIRFPGLTSNTPSPTNTWQELEFVFKLDDQSFDVYYGDVKIAENQPIIALNNGTFKKILLFTGRNSNGAGGLFYADDLIVTKTREKVSDEEALIRTEQKLRELFASALTDDVTLPTQGMYKTSVTWKSSDESVISSAGEITRLYKQDSTAYLKATIERGTKKEEYRFDVTVKGLDNYLVPTAEIMEKVTAGFDFSRISEESRHAVSKNLTLPLEYDALAASSIGGVKIKWESENTALIANDGTVNRKENAEKVKITGTFSALRDESVTAKKDFEVTLLPSGKVYFYESFDTPTAAEGATLHGWNGWSISQSEYSGTPVKDSLFTVSSEEENDKNKVASFYRPTCSSLSGYTTTTKSLDESIDGGTVSLRMRIKRKNDAAKILNMQLADNESHSMEFNFEFAQGRINSYANEPNFSIPIGSRCSVGAWHDFEFIFKLDKQKFDLYIDGTCVAEYKPMIALNNGTLSKITLFTHRTNNGAGALFYVDDIVMTKTGEKIADDNAAKEVAESIEAEFREKKISEDTDLPISGDYKSILIWESSDEDIIKVINGKGIVTPPDDENKEVTLTVSVVRGKVKEERSFNVTAEKFGGTLTATQELLDKAVDGFTFDEITDEKETMITHDLNLPLTYNKGYAKRIGGVNIKWTSSKPHVLANDGKITKQKYDTFLTLTAEFSSAENPEIKRSRDFKTAVLAEGEYILKDTFEEAPFDKMYQTFDDTGKVTEGGVSQKEVYDGWSHFCHS